METLHTAHTSVNEQPPAFVLANPSHRCNENCVARIPKPIMSLNFPAVVLACSLTFTCAMAQEWQPLFDGESLKGWRAAENPGSFKVADGMICCDGPRAHLFYEGNGTPGDNDYKNFELSVEVKTSKGANSGVFFHTRYQESDWPRQGMEAQVINARHGQDGYLENKQTGSLYGIRNIYKSVAGDGEWFTLRVSVRGKQVRTWVNDILLVDYTEFTPPPPPPDCLGRGTFALQCHDTSSKVFFRNLRVKRLPEVLPEDSLPQPRMTDYDRDVIRFGGDNIPMVNHHMHLKGDLTLEGALAQSRTSGIFLGVAVNCGLNFAVTNDAGALRYVETMRGQPCFVAMQAEGREWVKLFSKAAREQFDYVFTDAMTIVDDQGRRMRLWIPQEVPEITDKQAFMEMLVDRTVRILSDEPINIYVNPTYLPAQISRDYDELWTEARMRKVVDAAAEHRVAIEINSKARLPSPAFLKLAKAAGCKFTFGTNNTDSDIGRLDYCFEMVRELGLKWQDIWLPSKGGG